MSKPPFCTTAAFSTVVRDEIDLDDLTGELLSAVQKTMQPAPVSLLLRTPHRDGQKEEGLREPHKTRNQAPGSMSTEPPRGRFRECVTPANLNHHPQKDHRGRLLDIWRHKIPGGSR